MHPRAVAIQRFIGLACVVGFGQKTCSLKHPANVVQDRLFPFDNQKDLRKLTNQAIWRQLPDAEIAKSIPIS